jgi:hypothetical protein
MKGIYLTTIGVAVGVVLGSVVITAYESRRLGRISGELILESSRSRVLDDLNTLASLRRGDAAELIKAKEEDLSTELYGLARAFPTNSLSAPITVKILRNAAKYRASHPYTTGKNDIDQAIEDLLSQYSSNSK